MPIIKGIKRLNPLDVNRNVAIGVALPLNEVNLFKGTEPMAEQTKSNLINLLLTSPGERINLPNYGVGLRSMLFSQNINIELLKTKIIRSVERFIPNIIIDAVNTSLSEDKHTIFVTISYRSILNGSSDAIQLNFN